MTFYIKKVPVRSLSFASTRSYDWAVIYSPAKGLQEYIQGRWIHYLDAKRNLEGYRCNRIMLNFHERFRNDYFEDRTT